MSQRNRRRPEHVYRLRPLIAAGRIFLFAASAILLITFLGIAAAFLWFTLRAAIDPNDQELPSVLNGLVLMFMFLMPTIVPLVLWHLWPDIGISDHALWYWAGFCWHPLDWAQITDVEPALLVGLRRAPLGLLVHSNQLPFFFRFYAAAYGRQRGRALLVPAQLSRYQEVEQAIRAHLKDSHSSVNHRVEQ